jgi:hypothetical protein
VKPPQAVTTAAQVDEPSQDEDAVIVEQPVIEYLEQRILTQAPKLRKGQKRSQDRNHNGDKSRQWERKARDLDHAEARRAKHNSNGARL